RGKHQTKEVVLLPYMGGLIADTPGFSSLELNLYKEDLAIYFPMFNNLYNKCYYSNCLHLSENKCCVKQAIEEGKIPAIAYDCYKKLSDETIYRSKRYE
ncbi:MAG: ribosome small subunit-dependent GTPase A, partial [Bacilli bacterium]|nr:ribosome small subunit-dependent GTPase A [Bacilli bacterium]